LIALDFCPEMLQFVEERRSCYAGTVFSINLLQEDALNNSSLINAQMPLSQLLD